MKGPGQECFNLTLAGDILHFMANEKLELRCESLQFTPGMRVSLREHKRLLVCSSETRGIKVTTLSPFDNLLIRMVPKYTIKAFY
jgi:hypothetical protein